MDTVIIKKDELEAVFYKKLVKHGLGPEQAGSIASVFALNAADGILTHSVYRFERQVEQLDSGLAKPGTMPLKVAGFGGLERYDALFGPGITSAIFSMKRACELASENGIGAVALRNANHWMRAGYYALMASEKGYVGVCWTNTMANLCAWQSKEPVIGNNPVAMAMPSEKGCAMLVDSAMSQFSVGKTMQYAMESRPLPVPGGWDEKGELTCDAQAIVNTRRFLPAGYWKGSGFSMILDAMASFLSDGNTTSQIKGVNPLVETGLSQVFIAIDPRTIGSDGAQGIIDSIAKSVEPDCRIPGGQLYQKREKALKEGIEFSRKTWNDILAL